MFQKRAPAEANALPFLDSVLVQSTKIEGKADRIVLSVTHTFMVNNPLAIAQAMIFLKSGHFDHTLTHPELARRLTAK